MRGSYFDIWGIIIYHGGFLHNMGDFYITWGIIIYYGGFLYNLGDCYIMEYERFLIRMLEKQYYEE